MNVLLNAELEEEKPGSFSAEDVMKIAVFPGGDGDGLLLLQVEKQTLSLLRRLRWQQAGTSSQHVAFEAHKELDLSG